MPLRSYQARTGLIALLIAAGCRSTEVLPIGLDPVQTDDERAIWAESKLMDEELENSQQLVRDAALQEYLEGVAHKVLAQMQAPRDAEIRIRVLRQPLMNAAASANGTILLHTGILARIENEAELATLIGHELTHFVNRHALRERRVRWNSETRSKVAAGLAAVLLLNPGMYAIADSGSRDLIERQVSGYARELELEADLVGFEAMRAAGYDVRQSVRLFEVVLLDEDEPVVQDPYYYADHPSMNERAAHYRNLTEARVTASRIVGTRRYARAMTGIIEQNVTDDLSMGRTRSAKLGIDRLLAQREPSAQAYFLRGEWHRLTGAADGLEQAVQAYVESTRRNPDHAPAWRALGLAQRERGRRQEAARSLARAIELAPDAPDLAILESYLHELRDSEP